MPFAADGALWLLQVQSTLGLVVELVASIRGPVSRVQLIAM